MRLLILFISIVILNLSGFGQVNLGDTSSFQTKLSPEDISLFKDEVRYKVRLFYDSVLNILDDSLDIDSRYNARLVLTDLFSSSSASITDYLENPLPETHSIAEYSYLLFQLKYKTPLLHKSFKLGDSITIKQNIQGIKDRDLALSESERHDKYYNVYEGNMYYLEKTFGPKLEGSTVIDVDRRLNLKDIEFDISHNLENYYELKFKSMSIVNRDDINYKVAKKEVENAGMVWTDVAEKDYLMKITQDAFQKGIIIDIDTNKIANQLIASKVLLDSIMKSPSYEFRKLNIYDYLIPGLGHLKLGDKATREFRSIFYSGLFGVSIILGIKYNKTSKRQYETSLTKTDPGEKETWEEVSKKNNLAATIFFSTAAATFLANGIHVHILFRKTKKSINNRMF